MQVKPALGRVGTVVELEGDCVGVRLDSGGEIIRCRIADVIPFK